MRVAKGVVVLGTLLLAALALGTSLAMVQQGQAASKTKGPKPAPVAAPAAAAGVGQVDESSWVKLCHKNEETGNKQICVIQHEGLDPNTGIMLATSAVSTTEGEDKQTLMVGVTTAYTLVMPVGVQIKIDDSDPVALKYTVCGTMICQAQMDLTKETFDKMRKGKQMTVAAMNIQQKTMGFPVPLTGFGKAFDGPAADNAKYAEAHRQMIEQSRQRQIELARKAAEQPQAGVPPQAGAQVPAQPQP